MVKVKYNSNNFVNYRINTPISKSKYNRDNWIAFDLEWEVTTGKNNITFPINYAFESLDKNASGGSVPPVMNEQYHNIVTFGFEDSYCNSGCYDRTDFSSQKSFLIAIKEKLLRYKYCFAWGSKAIVRKNMLSGNVEGINGDLVVLDSNFRNNEIASIIKYDTFTSIPYIKNDFYQKSNQAFISDIDLLQVFAKPLVKNIIFKNKYKSLRLDEVSKALLGYGKLENKTGAKLNEMSTDERKSYCLHDAHIVAELVRINDGEILKIMNIIASHTELKFEQVCHKGMAGIWKKILNEAISKKISLIGYENLPFVLKKLYSNKTTYPEYSDNYYDVEEGEGGEEIIQKYKGGSVISPHRGLHYDVHVFDVTSLYPTIIINHNISPETVNCSCCRNDIKARVMFNQDYLKDCQFIPKKDKGYWICQRKKGLFSKILRE